MVLLFGESLTDDSHTPASRQTVLKSMVQRQWISERQAFEWELIPEEEVKVKFRNL